MPTPVQVPPAAWDFFIIHASPDAALAAELHAALRDEFTVFLDRASLPLGEEWDEALGRALTQTRVFLVLVTPHLDGAHFAREEYQRAINLRRAAPHARAVVPITPVPQAMLPYGLGLFHGLDFGRDGGLAGVTRRLKAEFGARRPEPPATVGPGAPAGHPLHSYSRYGRVPPEFVTEALVTAFASLHDPLLGPTLGLMFVDKASGFRRSADPDDPGVTVVEAYELPTPGAVPPLVFWRAVLSAARLHSPRMLAAVLLTANTNAFSDPARADHRRLLDFLRALPH